MSRHESLTAEQKAEILQLRKEGVNREILAMKYRVSVFTISRHCKVYTRAPRKKPSVGA
jgi:hypothetical protein